MIVPKETIEKMIDQADDRAEKAYRNYQETGTQRYAREQEKAEEYLQLIDSYMSMFEKRGTSGETVAFERTLQNFLPKTRINTTEIYSPEDRKQVLKNIESFQYA